MLASEASEGRALHRSVWNLAVIVAALGYFVDIYDLLLFGIVRQPSLTDLGYSGPDLLRVGTLLLDWQMGGMLLGGILWGILGDKRGRLSVLFGSIFLYSLANILNGSVHSFGAYALWRFVAGVGLAGELGAGITLVSEVMTREHRGYGTAIVSGFGIFGAVVAGLVGKMFDWRIAYYVGGGLGLVLLALRVGAYESGLFDQVRGAEVRRGNFLALFTDGGRLLRYLRGILIGVPTWYVVGILVIFAPEIAQAIGIALDPATGKTLVTGRESVMYHYAGGAIGSLLCGVLSQWLSSRKKAIAAFLLLDLLLIPGYLLLTGSGPSTFYVYMFVLGLMTGYWAVFVTLAAEQFGTNLRATVTTTTPNFVRGSAVPMTTAFVWLQGRMGSIVTAAAIVGAVVFALALWAVAGTDETYGRDLDYVEPV
jgi:predicted MFS family arabinose efflux permease